MNTAFSNAGRRTDSRIRRAAVAGRFYSADPAELRSRVQEMLEAVPAADRRSPKALIAPHAGYMFSGPIAASAFAQWKADADSITRVVIIGPAHYVLVEGLAASSAAAFETPLGLVPVDTEAVSRLESSGLVHVSDEAHAPEHSLEVELPFLQVILNHFSIVPLLTGEAAETKVEAAVQELWADKGTRVLISSDLSHFLDWDSARRMDQRTSECIERLAYREIAPSQACGSVPIRGLLMAAEKLRLQSRMLDLRNSGDISGCKDRVVGYGAFAIG